MMQRINLSVKILISQVNTAVLLCEELGITFAGKTGPFLNNEQRKRGKNREKKCGEVFFTLWSSELQPEVEWPGIGSGSSTSAFWVCAGGRGCASPPKHRMLAPYEHQLVFQTRSSASC